MGAPVARRALRGVEVAVVGLLVPGVRSTSAHAQVKGDAGLLLKGAAAVFE